MWLHVTPQYIIAPINPKTGILRIKKPEKLAFMPLSGIFSCGHHGKKISYLSPKRAPSPQNKSDSPQPLTNFMIP